MNDTANLSLIEQVIGDYTVLLAARGSRARAAMCPFHDDARYSLWIDHEEERWHCDVCNTGGGVIQFVAAYERCSEDEARQHIKTRISCN